MSPIQLFEQKKVRSHYDTEKEIWYFSVIDVIQILTGSTIPKRYWTDLKKKLKAEGSEAYDKIVQLKMLADDGKNRLTDTADTETLLRLIQSIPSPKAEPFKQWLAKVGYERIQELADPSQSLDRARENWQNLGRSEKWIQQRMTGQETRNKLTDYWKESGVEKKDEFAMLTNIIHQEWTGLSVKKHKEIKGLESQNLRDHMSEAELIFTALAELSTRQIAESEEAKGLLENAKASKKGGAIAKNARLALEDKTGKSVVTGENFLQPGKKRLE
ncbi:Bro-N domain-containing protein [Flavobacterium sp. MMLR14_040]|uniref:BRO-N domain-containing protein n=1 Tax=Flavobacterium sp. MMLR14_040 TaxID=3093843 RepID=UPI0029903C35|nr:Bro-N domain-containing protein [Flavobacterium sp. MMLR14_040]MDW8849518.1 Bro-N domain-containing protein [Flavobacterium sp. MMLR14_040]